MKLGRKRRQFGTPLIDLIEEAVALLRRAPMNVHLTYYLGAIPFWIGLLYFVSDMSQDAFASLRVLDASLATALLYIWKKAWQAVSAASLRTVLTGRFEGAWNVRRIWRLVCDQAAIQPWGLVLRPAAGVLTIPLVWVSAFYQNVTVLGDGNQSGSLLKRSIDQSKLWPVQAHGIVGVLSFFSFFVFLNFCLLLALGPSAMGPPPGK